MAATTLAVANPACTYAALRRAALAAQGERAQRGLEVGGGPSGFQFVLAASGCSVTNVEPALAQCMLLWKPQAT
jgi:hypothetical protein